MNQLKSTYINLGLSVLFVLFAISVASSQRPFIAEWETNGGVYTQQYIIFPAQGSYDYVWEKVDNPDINGNGTAEGNITINLPEIGKYKLEVTPTGSNPFHAIHFAGPEFSNPDSLRVDKLLKVIQWGDVAWKSLDYAFYGAEKLQITATDIPDLSEVNRLYYTFGNNKSLTAIPRIDQWSTSNVESMEGLFYNCNNIEIDISGWDISELRDIAYMFSGTHRTGSSIASWDVSKIEIFKGLFANAYQSIDLSGWDVRNAVDMSYMFDGNRSQIGDLSKWDVSKVESMASMFKGTSFNGDISDWNVSSLKDASNLFYGSYFTQDIGNWDVSKVEDMSGMFSSTDFNQDISSWDVSNVKDMSGMFAGTQYFNQDIGNWDVSKVEDMSGMFMGAKVFNSDIGSWNVGKVKNMRSMFFYNVAFNHDIGAWDVASVTDMSWMFRENHVFNQDISNWNTSNVLDMSSMIRENYIFNQDIGKWDISNVRNMDHMLHHAEAFDQSLENWNIRSLDGENMLFFSLNGSPMSCENFSSTLHAWAHNPHTPAIIRIGGLGPSYSVSIIPEVNYLEQELNWEISAGYSGNCVFTPTSTKNIEHYNLSFFPNPATDLITVEGIDGISELEILDMTGRILYTETLNMGGNSVDINTLQTGTYIVKVRSEDNRKVFIDKLVIL